MSHAIRVHAYGGPEVLKWENVDVGEPGPGEVRIKQTAVGLNYIDVYQRTGFYPQPSLPFIPGMERSVISRSMRPDSESLRNPSQPSIAINTV